MIFIFYLIPNIILIYLIIFRDYSPRDWIALKLRLGHPIPAIGGYIINASVEPVSVVE
jgi:hypothetical protein